MFNFNFNPFKKTVNSVMSAFNKAVADLERVHQRELERAALKEVKAAKTMQEANDARAEAERAAAVAQKLQALTAA